jgi:hypothetical protein
MILFDEYGGKTKRGNPFRVQIWQNHHGAFEGHVFLLCNRRIFSTYDQSSRRTAEKLAIKRAEKAGY